MTQPPSKPPSCTCAQCTSFLLPMPTLSPRSLPPITPLQPTPNKPRHSTPWLDKLSLSTYAARRSHTSSLSSTNGAPHYQYQFYSAFASRAGTPARLETGTVVVLGDGDEMVESREWARTPGAVVCKGEGCSVRIAAGEGGFNGEGAVCGLHGGEGGSVGVRGGWTWGEEIGVEREAASLIEGNDWRVRRSSWYGVDGSWWERGDGSGKGQWADKRSLSWADVLRITPLGVR
ncbi:hypothetical protein T440DRAFT_540218 [Plenodomus tracheiphilus IPT5]|uniref:Uncharacterized protein n=1 Tax=Plenodomus tracheiphilus IPT5 TaxID=1408161 RepID=A0A6A7AY04_9PLEO|nr:hypothetical protein T440DRAFT_540218 [Plenodomus tracheiphilus IPT5]